MKKKITIELSENEIGIIMSALVLEELRCIDTPMMPHKNRAHKLYNRLNKLIPESWGWPE